MSGTSIFPKAIDGYEQLPLAIDLVTEIDAASVNRLRCAIINIEEALGTLPQGDFDSVSKRFDLLELDVLDFKGHLSDKTNPHEISFPTLVGGTLSELNSIITDATIDDVSDPRIPLPHAMTHEAGGTDEITGDNLSINFNPNNYEGITSVLGGHLSGIDDKIGTLDQILVRATDETSDISRQLDRIIQLLSEIADVPIPDEPDVVTGPVEAFDIIGDLLQEILSE